MQTFWLIVVLGLAVVMGLGAIAGWPFPVLGVLLVLLAISAFVWRGQRDESDESPK